MAEADIQAQIDQLNKKLDYIIEEIEFQKRKRNEMDDMKEDLLRVGKDAFQTAVYELEEIHDEVQTGDIWYLFKKLLRNVNNITKSFDQLENVKGFLTDFSPISRELFIDFMKKLDEFDRKGYFGFLKEAGKIMDKIVTSYTPEDAKILGDNVVSIFDTIKNLTQPDMLRAINNAVFVYKDLNTDIKENISYFKLIKEINKPEVKKGLFLTLTILKNLNQSNK